MYSLRIIFSCFVLATASLPCLAQSGSFELVPGSLSQISVGADGAVWGLDSSQRIFTYDSASGQFVQIPGALTQIAVGNANAVWGIDAQDLVFRWDSATQSWTYIPGSLMQIAVAADGDVWGVNSDAQVWHYNQQAQSWDSVSGNFFGPISQIAAGNDGSIYLVNNFSPAYFAQYWYNPGAGQLQPFSGLAQPNQDPEFLTPSLAAGADGELWATGEGSVYHYNPLKAEWDEISNKSNYYFTQVAVGSGANVWALVGAFNSGQGPINGSIFRWNPQSATWVSVPGALSQIAAAADGSVWGINNSNQVFHYTGPAQPYHTLIQIPGSFNQISVAPDGTAWAVDANNLVYIFDRGTQTFQNVPGQSLAQVSVGSSGNVWGVSSAGAIFQWGQSTANAWDNIPGELNRIAVSTNQTYPSNLFVFGINSYGQTYMYVNGWIEIPGDLVQLSNGADGTVWGINAQQQIYRYESQTESWVNVPGSLVQISVGNANNIWGVNAAQQVYRYDTTAQHWVEIPNSYLTQISVAFDGTVWGANGAGALYQWDSTTQTFNYIGEGVTNVAVGNDNIVFAYNKNTGATYWYF